MSLLAAVGIVGPAMAAAYVALLWQKRRDARDAAAVPRKPAGRRYVDAPGFPQPLVHRVPGATIAAYRPCDADEDGPDVWVADFPPGSLGEHPETAPVPGPLLAEPADVEDFLTGVLRHLRATHH